MPTGPQRPAGRPRRGPAADEPPLNLPYGEWLARAAGASRPQLRARAAAGAMLAVFLAATLAAGWLPAAAGLGFLAGAAGGAWYCRRPALLRVVVIPPALFLAAVLLQQAFTAQGASARAVMESVLAGTLLMLSANAPWLFCGMIAAVAVAWRRGLRECARELRADLAGTQASAAPPARQPAVR